MSLIKHLKETICPTCFAGIYREEVERTSKDALRVHINGQQFESRTFMCGCQMDWVPNFGRAEIRYKCPNRPEEAKKRQTVQLILGKVHELLFEELANLGEYSAQYLRDALSECSDLEMGIKRIVRRVYGE